MRTADMEASMRTLTFSALLLVGVAGVLTACTSSTEYEPTTYYHYPCSSNACGNYGVNVIPEEAQPGSPQYRPMQ